VIGTGEIASTYARDLALLPEEARLVAVGSRRRERAQSFADAHGFTRAYGSYAELVDDPEVDVVYVATPHHDHLGSARLALEAGKPVLVEKPLTLDAGQTEQLIDLARDRGVFLMEAVWMRTSPLIRRAAEIVAAGEIGRLRHLSANFGFAFDGPDSHRLLDPAQGGGAILDLGVYPVHAANLFLGEPSAVYGFGSHAGTGVESHAAALLTFDAEQDRPPTTAAVVCSLETSMPTSLEIYGTRGRIMIDTFFIRPAEIAVFRGTGPDVQPEVMITQWPGGGYTFQAQEVMRCLRNGQTESALVPWADTLAVARTLDDWLTAVSIDGQSHDRSTEEATS
jgi:predicted dehydrogenase